MTVLYIIIFFCINVLKGRHEWSAFLLFLCILFLNAENIFEGYVVGSWLFLFLLFSLSFRSSITMPLIPYIIISTTEEEAEDISAVGYMFEAATFSSADKIRAEVTFKENDDRYKYSDFDSGKYISVKVKNYVVAERSASFLHSFADKTRKGILAAANSLGPDEAAKLLGAVLIGNKRAITVDLSDDVRATGTSHMLVVSGLHLGILCGLVMRLPPMEMHVEDGRRGAPCAHHPGPVVCGCVGAWRPGISRPRHGGEFRTHDRHHVI